MSLNSIRPKNLVSIWVKLVMRIRMEEIKICFIIILVIYLPKEKTIKGIHWICRLSWTPPNNKKIASKKYSKLISS